MTSSRIQPIKKTLEEPTRTPEEVLRLQSLLMDNGWKMLVERIQKTIDYSEAQIKKPRPVGMSKEQSEIWYDDMERIKLKIEAYEELLQLPEEIMKEYGETEFRVNYTKNI